MFEPVHGSAPSLAGKNVANPMGAILSVALMLDHLGLREEAAAVESAVHHAVAARQGTSDIGGSLGTRETGDCIASVIRGAKT
jgi:3-isopropylmalate dehydrogenase